MPSLAILPLSLRLPLVALLAALLATAPVPSSAADVPAGQRASSGSPAPRGVTGARSGDGWRSAPPAAWVVRHDTAISGPAEPGPLPARGGWHVLLVDQQSLIDRDEQSSRYFMMWARITDASGLGSAGRIEVTFDPSYQKVQLHAFAVWRGGRRLDRLADARIELLRREEGLENEAIDGRKTLLVVLNDVRVGDTLEVSYSVTGHNPVHGPSHGGAIDTAYSMPVDRLLAAVTSRSARRLHFKGVRTGELPAVRDEAGVQHWQLELADVAAVQPEDEVPSDYAMYPRVDYSDDADWHEVAAWGVKLFAVDPALGPDLEHRLDALRAKGLRGQALASAALSLVQDDVRYFSASLGENSHRPKTPARTWADRAGDCKDKTALLVAILQRLGFDAAPALVSTTARGSLQDLPPGHDPFDHAIVRLRLDGHTWWLDGTSANQATPLDTRAAPAVDWALVVAPATQALEAVQAPPPADPLVTYDHVWDTGDLSKPARLQLVVTTRAEMAEGYRGAIAAGHLAELVDGITSRYRARFADYRQVGTPVVEDDRVANRLSVRIEGEVPLLGEVRDGLLAIEVYPLRLMDSLSTPTQLQRAMPWSWQPPRTMVERIRVVLPVSLHLDKSLQREVSDPHFELALSTSGTGRERVYDWHFERRADVVRPADLARFRDRIAKARSEHDFVLSAPLLDADQFRVRADESLKASASDPRLRGNDEIATQIGQAWGRRLRDDMILSASGPQSRIGARVLLDRAMQDTLLGEDSAAQADLGQLAPSDLETPAAQYTRGLVLFAAGRFADAEQAFGAGVDAPDPQAGPARRWVGIAAYYDGRLDDAVRDFREAAQAETGDERGITLAWLFLAAQRHDAHGEAALAPFLAAVPAKDGTWPGPLLATLRAFAAMDPNAAANIRDPAALPVVRDLLEVFKKDPATRRERAVQSLFFMSQFLAVMGDRGASLRMLELARQTSPTTLAEDICARTELRRSTAKAPAGLLEEAQRQLTAGNRRAAGEALQRAVAAAPDDADALSALARVELDQRHCAALDPMRRAASLRPEDPVLGVLFAQALVTCGTPAQAKAALGYWIADARTPDIWRAAALATRSKQAADSGDDQQQAQAEKDAREAVRLSPEIPAPWMALLTVDVQQGRLQEALHDADRMEQTGAEAWNVAVYRGNVLLKLGRDAEAEAEFTRSLALAPGREDALGLRSEARLHRKDVDGALRDALELAKSWPDSESSWMDLQKAQEAAGHRAEAREAVVQRIRLEPGHAWLWEDRGRLDAALGDDKASLEAYDRSVALNPDSTAWISRGRVLWRLDRGGEAVASCLRGVANYDTPLNRSACAVIEWKAGDDRRAIATIDELASHRQEMQAGDHMHWFNDMGLALMSYGRPKDALPFLQFEQQRDPESAYVPLFIYFARALSGDEAAARAALVPWPVAGARQWQSHLIDYVARRIDDDALRQLSRVDAPGDVAGQACEATFYIGLRHWVDGDVSGGRTLLAQAAAECPRDFSEFAFARAWFRAGPASAGR